MSVLTPSIPPRASLLEECRRSVEAQTEADWEHLVEIDTHREGCSKVMNRLAAKARGVWVLPLADDDLILPGALRNLLAHSYESDIIYAPPLMWGWDSWHFFQEPPNIPSFALIKRSLWEQLGGYDESVIREEDRGLWTRALEAGATFQKVDTAPIWVYRIHGGNKSLNAGVAA